MNFVPCESLERLGFNAFFQRQFAILIASSEAPASAVPARVLSAARGHYSVSTGAGVHRALLAGRLLHRQARVCVGDFVLLEAEPNHDLARIVHVFEQSSLFQRRAPGGTSQAQTIAANVDLAIVVCALVPDDADPHAHHHGLNPRRIERYLRAVRDAPARALVAINKADLSSRASEHAEALRAELRGVEVVLVSAEQPDGVSELEQRLLPSTTAVLVGSSGVGKSSLANRLLGGGVQATGAVREEDGRGRHTTTSRELFVLPGGALLIDTPGMREFALFADDTTELHSTGFAELDELAPSCRFRDCQHRDEPGCAVLAAVHAGSVEEDRLQQAHKLQRELEWQRDRHDPRKMSEVRAGYRSMTRSARALQKQKSRG